MTYQSIAFGIAKYFAHAHVAMSDGSQLFLLSTDIHAWASISRKTPAHLSILTPVEIKVRTTHTGNAEFLCLCKLVISVVLVV